MAIGIAEIDEQRVADAVTAGPALEIAAIAEAAGDVAHVNEVAALRHREGEVMQARTTAVGEHDVMRIALALQPGAPQFVAAVGCGELGQPETERGVELGRAQNVLRDDL